MACVTYVYPKRADTNSTKSNGLIRKHSYVTPVTRRAFHIVCGFLIGLLAFYALGPDRAGRMCAAGAGGARTQSDAAQTDPAAALKAAETSTTTSNRSRSLLFVGVMTAQKYLETRAAAVYQSWGKEVPGGIGFFSSATSTVPANCPQLPLVRLYGVDDSYPPQKKSFMMLQYMWENHGNEYEWFLRADDDVYIRPDKLEKFLRSVNSSRPHFIGQAGRGNQEEFGLLSLEYDQNFCMGGPGIIFSRETLKMVAPHVKHCLRNLYTAHEDVELGRCVQKFAKIPCTWSYEMQSIFYHNFSGASAFTGSLKTKEVHRAITLHPIKHHQHMYRVHNYMQGLKIHELQQRKISLYRDLRHMEDLSKTLPPSDFENFKNLLSVEAIESNPFRKAELFGVPPDLNKYRPRNEEDVFTWELINRALYSDTNLNPRRKIESYFKEGLDDVIREVMDNINLFSRERGRVIEFQQILYGYYRLNPLYGPDYILDVLLTFKKYRGRKMTVPVRRHAYIQQQFADLEIRESTDTLYDVSDADYEIDQKMVQRTPSDERSAVRIPIESDQPVAAMIVQRQPERLKKINMIVPLFRKYEAFRRFMRTFEEVCLRPNDNVRLFVVLFVDESSEAENDLALQRVLDVINDLNSRYEGERIKLSSVRAKFARAKALSYGMARAESHELLFFIDVDMVWTADTLHRVRLNTVAGERVYFPVVFSQFDPTITYRMSVVPNHFLINDETGYWRVFGFGIMSAYKSDIEKVGGFDTSIVGWGREDVDLLEKFIANANSNVSILRSVDPNLVHIFHIVDCDPSLDLARLNMCRNTRSETYGSVNQLANLVYRYKENVFEYAVALQRPANKPNR